MLGYIFEKYVNQKQMGAYYTKEDITGYMTGYALAPVFVDALESAIGSGPWEALREEPERFVLKALLHGVEAPLPTPQVEGDRPPPSVALPGESWLEVADRREYARWLLELCASGAVTDTEACTKLNLNLPELAVAFVALIDDPEDLLAAYKLLRGLTVLDPTCGSGAFLFAALRLLATLYDVVLDRAEEMVRDGRDTADAGLGEFLGEMRAHPSREYFVLKAAVLSNLYGVDLMEEATEIARLRLFLALVARLNSRDELEPLPDLDLNIRAGNLLVGVIDTADAERRFEGYILALETLPGVRERASEVAETYREFVRKQRADEDVADLKERLRLAKHDLSAQLDDLYIATLGRTVDRDAWRASHQPFHWLIEFPHAIERGGFDVVVGNPPYIRTSRLGGYAYSGFTTDQCPDIFAPCMERASQLVGTGGGFAMIVPIAFQFSKDYDAAREAIARELPSRFASTYSRNPSALFTAGLGVRSTVVIGRKGGAGGTCCTDTRRWVEDFRPFLFETNRYTGVPTRRTTDPWPRLGHEKLVELYEALLSRGGAVGDSLSRAGHKLGFKQTALYYLSVFVDEPPAWDQQGNRVAQTKVGTLTFASETERDVAFVLLAGRLGVWWWGATGDDFDVTTGLLASFPVSLARVRPAWPELAALGAELRAEQPKHPIVTLYAGKEMGNYDLSRCRHITDRADRVVLRTLDLEELWPYVLLADARLAKATGERPGTEREWPFAWSPPSG